MPGPSPLPPSTVEVVPARAVTPIPTPLATATAAPTATPTPAPPATPQPPGTAQGDVIIECIFFDGEVPRSEADEYVQLTNQGSVAADLRGWTLVDLDDRGQMFTFGESYSIAPGGSVRIYTNQVHPEWGGFSFDYGRSIWNNSNPDTAGLFDPSGNQVSRKSYPPGC
ncbi:MAG: lamin tail domain-containing protein [Chloroflexi bacterium]|nr:lamin tail domain-containing protein [Chloroflexota bacterium]